MTRRLLIDGDVVLYEVCLACETATDWGDDMWTLHSDFKEAKQRFDVWVVGMQERLEATEDPVIALSDKRNWRKDVLPAYKSNRKGRRKPLIFKALRAYAEDTYNAPSLPKLEADDLLGLYATGPQFPADEKIIVTIDKDLLTIPGLCFYFNKTDDGILAISEEQADANHLIQAIAGDPVDGYSGCPGLGIVRAGRMIKESATWDTVVAAYVKAGLTEEDALLQARVARILRHREYEFSTSTVHLWNPRKEN
jgi:DNA polymerase-1